MSATTYPSLALIERWREVDKRLWDVMAADDADLPMLLQAMRVEKALRECPASDSLAELARMR